jgi:uncharacterized protein DUF5615
MSLRLIADENFNGAMIRGLMRIIPGLDLVRVQDVGLSGTEDPTILEWAASQNRILLSHDIRTVPPHAYERLSTGKRMAGVFIVPEWLPNRQRHRRLAYPDRVQPRG